MLKLNPLQATSAGLIFCLAVIIQIVQLRSLQNGFDKVRPGMSKEEVINLIGRPGSKDGSVTAYEPVWNGKALGPEYGRAVEGWRYGSLAAPFQIWGISFSKDGKVNQIYIETSP